MGDYIARIKKDAHGVPGPIPLPNVWIGTSIEDRKALDRIDHLRQTPAAVRFLSIEPLLEDLGNINLEGIHQVIVGGESGPGARPMHPDWARWIRDQCIAADVPFFFKQWGEYLPFGQIGAECEHIITAHGQAFYQCKKKRSGRLLDGRTWDEYPKAK